MRITNNMLINNMINQVGTNMTRMDKYQNQLATGKKISVPSDDPVVAARALKLRTDVAEVDQYGKNVKDAQSWLDMTDSTLNSMGDLISRAKELAVQGANGTNTVSDTQKIGDEVTQLRNQLVHLGNTTYAGKYLFSGYSTDKELLVSDESSPNFGQFAIPVSNGEQIKFEVGIGDDININVPGSDIFNNGAAVATPPQVSPIIQHFNDFITALNSGDSSKISSMITTFEGDSDNLLRVRADVGARSNRLDLTSNRLDSDNTNFTKLMSDNEDVDMAETIMNLQNEQNVYRASLAGGAKVIQPTLVDFLR